MNATKCTIVFTGEDLQKTINGLWKAIRTHEDEARAFRNEGRPHLAEQFKTYADELRPIVHRLEAAR